MEAFRRFTSTTGATTQVVFQGQKNVPGQYGEYAIRTAWDGLTFRNTQSNALMLKLGNTGNVGIGTTNPGAYKLAVEGIIGARDIIVTNVPWSDYVFRPGYRLRPLSEVNAFIQANHHLPDIPSEAEVKAQGVSVVEMQSKLLAKVEELTLHMIQQEKENQALRERIAQLEIRSAGSTAPAAGR